MHAFSSPASPHARGVALMLASAVGFSVMSLLVKMASATMPTMEIVFARSVFMGILSGGLVVRAGGSLAGHDRRRLLARGVAGAAALSLLYWGLGRLPLGDAITVHYTVPVWTALLAAALLGEHVRPVVLVAAAASLAGVVLVARPSALFDGSGPPVDRLAVAAVGVAAVLSGLAYTLVRALRATDAPQTIIFYLSWVGAVVAAPFALAGAWTRPSPTGWALLAGIGLATQLGQVALTHALRSMEAGAATAIGYVQVVLAFGWGVLIFGEQPDALALGGSAVVLASVALVAFEGGPSVTPPGAPEADPRSRRRDAGAG